MIIDTTHMFLTYSSDILYIIVDNLLPTAVAVKVSLPIIVINNYTVLHNDNYITSFIILL